jgi:hypothetical protein
VMTEGFKFLMIGRPIFVCYNAVITLRNQCSYTDRRPNVTNVFRRCITHRCLSSLCPRQLYTFHFLSSDISKTKLLSVTLISYVIGACLTPSPLSKFRISAFLHTTPENFTTHFGFRRFLSFWHPPSVLNVEDTG